jgi:hypothetical protein
MTGQSISSPALLRAAATEIEALRAYCDQLVVEKGALIDHQRAALRAMYRRGYFAGRASAKAGHPEVTNPERRARGAVRQLLTASEEPVYRAALLATMDGGGD